MKRSKLALATTSALFGLSMIAGSMANAQTGTQTADQAELAQFLAANPNVAAVIANVETQTGGTVVEAEFDDDVQGNGVVEFEVRMADGSEQDILYVLADGTMTVEVDND